MRCAIKSWKWREERWRGEKERREINRYLLHTLTESLFFNKSSHLPLVPSYTRSRPENTTTSDVEDRRSRGRRGGGPREEPDGALERSVHFLLFIIPSNFAPFNSVFPFAEEFKTCLFGKKGGEENGWTSFLDALRMSTYQSLYARLSAYLPIKCLSVCLPAWRSIKIKICLSIWITIYTL